MNFVLDASIALKWYYRETDSPQARLAYDRISRGSHFAVAPFLLYIEVTNALITRRKVPETVAKQVLADLHNLPLETVPYSQTIAESAIELTIKYSLTVYDAIYLALAKNTDIPLLTADNRLIEADPKSCLTLDDLV